MKNGMPEGYWKTYYENGVLKTEGNRKNFMLDSTWKFYNSSGFLTDIINYTEDKKNGAQIFFEDSIKKRKDHFENGIQNGFSVYYYSNGSEQKLIPFEKGVEEGKGKEFSRDGRLIALLTYKDGFLRKTIKLNRKDKLGRKQGLWQEYYEDDVLKMEGVYVDDKKNGLFKYYDEKGNLNEILKYEEDMLDEDAQETVVLDIRNEYSEDGRVISSGGYKEGQKHGTHRIFDENGEVSSGTIYEFGIRMAEGRVDKNGSFEGEWKLYYPTGELRAEGEYKDGKKVKQWKFYHKNGSIEQKGKYVKGKPHGEWRWFYESGDLHREELYRKGKEDGLSVEYDINGEIITKGEYISGFKEGEWFYKVGDHTEVGAYSDGEKNGEWLHTYDNGKTNFKGEYANGLAIGKHKYYHRSGRVKEEGKYNSGFKEGEWKRYDEEGSVLWSIVYDNGIERRVDGKKIKPTYEELEN
ncbi:MAG: hypothetical protein AAF487_09260 [Bacteroidota bacterium]